MHLIRLFKPGVMAKRVRREGMRKEKEWREIVMDDTTSSIVSYHCGLNALGSWPRSVLVHIIKLHEEEEEGTLELLPGQVHG